MTERTFAPPIDTLDACPPADPDASVAPPWAADGLSVDERVAVREQAIDDLTDHARGCAAAVSAAWVALVDAAAALEPLEGAYTATWRQWVAWQCGLTSGEAARVCTLANRLPEQPGIEAAFRAGELSPAVVALLLDVATPENEAALLETARIATGRQLEVLVRDFRRAQRDIKASQDPELAPSEVSWGWKRGRFAGRFDCRPDHGAIVEAALEDAYNKGRPDQDAVDNATPIVEGELRDDETPRVTRADALVGLATGYLAGRENSKGMLPELTQITLHRNCRPDGTDPGAHDPLFPTLLPGHGAIHDRLVALLECDATIVDQPMWRGHPSALPSRTRRFNRRQRRALAARDLTCRFPGCGRTRHLHAHHSIRATDGGPTDLINLTSREAIPRGRGGRSQSCELRGNPGIRRGPDCSRKVVVRPSHSVLIVGLGGTTIG